MNYSLDADGEVAQKLKVSLTQKLQTLSLSEDADYVAEFIVVMISNKKNPSDIVSELANIFGDSISEDFIRGVFQDLERLVAPPRQPMAAQTAVFGDLMGNIPTQPRATIGRGPSMRGGRGGIGKPSERGGRNPSYGMRNQDNFQRAVQLSMQNGGSHTSIQRERVPFVQKRGKGRCRQFPYCKDKECGFSHPTRNCFAFPNCANPAGTCNYLHPGEDDELIAELAKSKEAFSKTRVTLGTIGICKFGIICQKEICPFGHPTPANKDAKVILLEWCVDGKGCHDNRCQKAHPSPNFQPTQETPEAEKSLEPCKFGVNCMNMRCPRRHASSPVMCREGAECKRFDCFFSHPINAPCRFEKNCKNKNCIYQHPPERAELINKPMVWSRDGFSNNGTSQRQFAVPEDQVMDQDPL